MSSKKDKFKKGDLVVLKGTYYPRMVVEKSNYTNTLTGAEPGDESIITTDTTKVIYINRMDEIKRDEILTELLKKAIDYNIREI